MKSSTLPLFSIGITISARRAWPNGTLDVRISGARIEFICGEKSLFSFQSLYNKISLAKSIRSLETMAVKSKWAKGAPEALVKD